MDIVKKLRLSSSVCVLWAHQVREQHTGLLEVLGRQAPRSPHESSLGFCIMQRWGHTSQGDSPLVGYLG